MPPAYNDFHSRLHAWYRAHGRHELPWRNTADPYAIYVSEVMLQQTQVATVLERYYFPFLQKFPTLNALAGASEREVLKAWEGLGYYSRARNMLKAALSAGGALPQEVEKLMELPGIGRNTAHAVAAFAFRQPVPVMEANVRRALCRLFALSRPEEKTLWAHAHALLDTRAPFDYNQAMMDLGSMVCTPRSPLCTQCPATTVCQGRATPERFPRKKLAKQTPVRKARIIIAHTEEGNVYLSPRASRFLGGLYGFPELGEGELTLEISGKAAQVSQARKLGAITHTYSHFRLEAEVYALTLCNSFNVYKMYTLKEIEDLPLSKADSKALALWRGGEGSSPSPAPLPPRARRAT